MKSKKIKSYLKTNADIEKLEGKLYVLSKLLYNFFRKKPKKMPQNNEQLSARLAEIYQMLSNIQELWDAVMFSTDIDINIKCVFLIWYEMELASIKEELDEITSIVLC